MTERDGRIAPAAKVRLKVGGARWAYALDRRDDIEQHWQAARRARPALFDGIVHMERSGALEGDAYQSELVATGFKSFLHWRDNGFPDASVRGTGAGCALLAREGHLLVGVAAGGTANAGRAYLFSGVIDERDVSPVGEVDVRRVALRELAEETGLDSTGLAIDPGTLIVLDRHWTTFVVVARSKLCSEDLCAVVLAQLASELADVRLLRSADDITPDLLGHTRAVARHLLAR